MSSNITSSSFSIGDYSQPRIVTNDTQLTEKNVPAALKLEFGQLFFGYPHIPVGGKDSDKEQARGGQRVITDSLPRSARPSQSLSTNSYHHHSSDHFLWSRNNIIWESSSSTYSSA